MITISWHRVSEIKGALVGVELVHTYVRFGEWALEARGQAN